MIVSYCFVSKLTGLDTSIATTVYQSSICLLATMSGRRVMCDDTRDIYEHIQKRLGYLESFFWAPCGNTF